MTLGPEWQGLPSIIAARSLLGHVMNRFLLAKSVVRAVVLAGAAMAMVAALAANTMGHLRGTIVSATASELTVRTAEGDVKVAIDPTTRIAGIVPSSVGQIKAGTFVGIANVPGKSASRALEVVVFPDALKGAGLGDYPWDLAPKSGAGRGKTSAMTNGTVTTARAAAKSSAMTNGTVKSTSNASGLLLSVDYGKGEKKIQVPAGVPVVGVVPGDASKLVAGAHVFVSTRKDAPQTAAFISVGIDGAVPPM
jgi:hypothetical protein